MEEYITHPVSSIRSVSELVVLFRAKAEDGYQYCDTVETGTGEKFYLFRRKPTGDIDVEKYLKEAHDIMKRQDADMRDGEEWRSE